MDTKLTLKIRKIVISQAKNYAKSKNTSVSKLVENYLHTVSSVNNEKHNITPLVRSLSGVISIPDGTRMKHEYSDYLINKYK